MSRTMFSPFTIAGVLTLAALITWFATGAHPYTKYEDVTRQQVSAGADDPFAETGFYDGDMVTKTVKRDVFYFGLLPVPQGLFDKHAVSVVSVVVPVWLAVGGLALMRRRSAKTRGGRIPTNDLTLPRTLVNTSDSSQT